MGMNSILAHARSSFNASAASVELSSASAGNYFEFIASGWFQELQLSSLVIASSWRAVPALW